MNNEISHKDLLQKYYYIERILEKNIRTDLKHVEFFENLNKNIKQKLDIKLKNVILFPDNSEKNNLEINKLKDNFNKTFIYFNYLDNNNFYIDFINYLNKSSSDIGRKIFTPTEFQKFITNKTSQEIFYNSFNNLNDKSDSLALKYITFYFYHYIYEILLNKYISIINNLSSINTKYQDSIEEYNPNTLDLIKDQTDRYLNETNSNLIDNLINNMNGKKLNKNFSSYIYQYLMQILYRTNNFDLLTLLTNNIIKELIIIRIKNKEIVIKSNIDENIINSNSINKLKQLKLINDQNNIDLYNINKYIRDKKITLSNVIQLEKILNPEKSKIGSFETIAQNIIIFIVITIIILLLLLIIFLTLYLIYKTIQKSKCIDYFSNLCDFNIISNYAK